ncbi:MAG TPA: hypothetical protein VF167_09470 [Longimicrobiaceae bacterium]
MAGNQHAGTVATENPGAGGPGQRHEVGDAATSRRDPPHVTESDESSPVRQDGQADAAPVLPANAGGSDNISSEEHDLEIEEESAYDRRPTQDKDRPPSER